MKINHTKAKILECIGIIDNSKKAENRPLINNMLKNLHKLGYNLLINSNTKYDYENAKYCSIEQIMAEASLLLVLGGDGSLLHSARLAAEHNLPVLGVNFGKLGFLTETEIHALPEKISRLERGEYLLEQRPLLSASCLGKEVLALNEIAIDKGNSTRVIKLEVYIDGRYFSTYTSDGLLISTAIGSTAYNLSAGGPIIQPGVAALVLTPLNPHALAMRPFIIPDSVEIKIIARSEQNSMLLSGDGQESINLQAESEIIINKHAVCVTFVRFSDSDFYGLLREKLGWGGFVDRRLPKS